MRSGGLETVRHEAPAAKYAGTHLQDNRDHYDRLQDFLPHESSLGITYVLAIPMLTGGSAGGGFVGGRCGQPQR